MYLPPFRNFTLQVGATYVDSKVLGYYVSSSRWAVARPIRSIFVAKYFHRRPNRAWTLTPNMIIRLRVIGPASSRWARPTKALRKPPSDSRFALLSERGGSLVDSFGRSEMSEQR